MKYRRRKDTSNEEGMSNEEFLAYFEQVHKEELEYNRINNIQPPIKTRLEILDDRIAELSVLYNKDKKYGKEATELIKELQQLEPKHSYLIFLNHFVNN